jgi:hypothetical protein
MRAMGTSAKIVPTMIVFDARNISTITKNFLNDPPSQCIIKASHISGGVH